MAERVLVAEEFSTEPVRWRVRARLERPRSTLFVLEARHAGNGSIRLHYKHEHILGHRSEKRERKVQLQRRALQREPDLSAALTKALCDEPVAVDHPVAVDPERLVAVRMHVVGTRLGRVVQRALRGRGRAWWPYRVLGRVLRTMERLDPPSLQHVLVEDARPRLERRIANAWSQLPERQRGRVETRVGELLSQAGSTAMVWSHGDVTESNVLVDDERRQIGLIDFTWHLRPVGHDAAQFVARLEYERPRLPSWTAAARAELFEGYGVDPQAPTAEWQLACFERALICLSKRNPRAQSWGRALVEREVERVGTG